MAGLPRREGRLQSKSRTFPPQNVSAHRLTQAVYLARCHLGLRICWMSVCRTSRWEDAALTEGGRLCPLPAGPPPRRAPPLCRGKAGVGGLLLLPLLGLWPG